jgi:hypothetical protein
VTHNKDNNGIKNMFTKKLKEIYQGLNKFEKTEVQYTLAKRCGVSPATVRNWCYGINEPSELAKGEIKKYFKKIKNIEL